MVRRPYELPAGTSKPDLPFQSAWGSSQVRPGPVDRVLCLAGAVWGTVPQAARVGCGPCSGWSGCCECGEWLAVLSALLSRVVEQWLSSNALGFR